MSLSLLFYLTEIMIPYSAYLTELLRRSNMTRIWVYFMTYKAFFKSHVLRTTKCSPRTQDVGRVPKPNARVALATTHTTYKPLFYLFRTLGRKRETSRYQIILKSYTLHISPLLRKLNWLPTFKKINQTPSPGYSEVVKQLKGYEGQASNSSC